MANISSVTKNKILISCIVGERYELKVNFIESPKGVREITSAAIGEYQVCWGGEVTARGHTHE